MDSPPRIKLRLMNSDGPIPSGIHDHPIKAWDTPVTTDVFQTVQGPFECRPEREDSEIGADVVARIYTSHLTCVLKPYANVIVEPPLSGNASRTVVPPGDQHVTNYIYLRPDDTIDFPDQGLKIRIIMETGEALASEIEVKSSNLETTVKVADDQATDSEDDDGDHITPTRADEPTVKETPNHEAFVNMLPNEESPYATAQDLQTNEARASEAEDIIGDPGSPSLLAQKSDFDEVDKALKPRIINTTYGKQSNRRSTPKTIVRQAKPGVIDSEGQDVMQDMPLTSDPLSTSGVMRKAVERSFSPPSAKRKSEEAGNDDETGTPESKKPKMESAEPETPSHEDMDDTSSHSERRSKPSTGKLKKVNRHSNQESGDEISVAPRKSERRKHSPVEVVIQKTRKSQTPTSSASSIPYTGKVSKILVSSESAVQKNAALKNWLRKQGVTIIDQVPSKATHFVCVVSQAHNLKTIKVLHSLAMNKYVVTDDWLTDSKEQGELQDYTDYVHKTLEAVATHDKSRIFAGKHLYFTRQVVANYKDGWKDIQDVAKAAGATEVDKLDFDRPSHLRDGDDVVLFGSNDADEDVAKLINDYGRTVYSKDCFTESIISGDLSVRAKLAASARVRKSRRS